MERREISLYVIQMTVPEDEQEGQSQERRGRGAIILIHEPPLNDSDRSVSRIVLGETAGREAREICVRLINGRGLGHSSGEGVNGDVRDGI
jgi:hypothetical protein